MNQGRYLLFLLLLVTVFLTITVLVLSVNDYFLNYDPQLFNNVVTPFATITSAIIFLFSLILIYNQNFVTNSGLLLNTYLEKSNNLKEKGLSWDFHHHYPKEMKRLNINWKPNLITSAQLIDNLCMDIACSKEYHNLVPLINSEQPVSLNDFEKLSREKEIFQAINYSSAVIFEDIQKYHFKLCDLIIEISYSPSLTKQHKKILLDYLTNDILDEYLSYCDVLINGSRALFVNIRIPDFKKSGVTGNLEVIGILEQERYFYLYDQLRGGAIISKNRKRGLVEQHG